MSRRDSWADDQRVDHDIYERGLYERGDGLDDQWARLRARRAGQRSELEQRERDFAELEALSTKGQV